MLIFIHGTIGEVIKQAPLLKAVKKSEYIVLNTNQQPKKVAELEKQLKLHPSDIHVGSGFFNKDLSSLWQAPFWFVSVFIKLVINTPKIKKIVRKSKTEPLILVHGDTTTTTVGALYGKIIGFPVAHIEAGLRSHNWKHPFPEEISRRLVAKMARLHYAPGDVPYKDLMKESVKGRIVNTVTNTVRDSFNLALEIPDTTKEKLPKKYGLISIHRTEFLVQRKLVEEAIRAISEISDHHVVFVEHPVTSSYLKKYNLSKLLDKQNIVRISKQPYVSFAKIVKNSEWIFTDSGGLQEESAYLGIPCLVHRLTTERQDGVDKNVKLSKFDISEVRRFFKNPSGIMNTREDIGTTSPTEIIIHDLKENGYIN